jgi:opacity protein-like surface antigen
MKNNLIYTFFTIFTLTNCVSQNINYGIKAGVNISSFDGSITNKSLIGPQVGGFAEITINDKLTIQPELLLSMQGAEFEYSLRQNFYEPISQKRLKISLYYLNLPITVKYNFIDKFSIIAGPQIGYLVKATQKNKSNQFEILNSSDETDIKNLYKTISYSFNLGLNYNVTEEMFVDVRYNYGLSNILNGNNTLFGTGLKNNVIQFSIGYRL